MNEARACSCANRGRSRTSCLDLPPLCVLLNIKSLAYNPRTDLTKELQLHSNALSVSYAALFPSSSPAESASRELSRLTDLVPNLRAEIDALKRQRAEALRDADEVRAELWRGRFDICTSRGHHIFTSSFVVAFKRGVSSWTKLAKPEHRSEDQRSAFVRRLLASSVERKGSDQLTLVAQSSHSQLCRFAPVVCTLLLRVHMHMRACSFALLFRQGYVYVCVCLSAPLCASLCARARALAAVNEPALAAVNEPALAA
eukprot:2759673-Pleurochrysis_carterae.AAC.1